MFIGPGLEKIPAKQEKSRRPFIDSGANETEEEGFEPPVPCGTAVFKTATLSHSVTPPAVTPSVVL